MTYINPETAGKERNLLIRDILIAMRELNQSQDFNTEAKDIVAFIALNLGTIYKGIDDSVIAWEKRNYWAKADKFRMEWYWTRGAAIGLRRSLEADDIPGIMRQFALIHEKFAGKTLPKSAKLSRFTLGSYKQLISSEPLA